MRHEDRHLVQARRRQRAEIPHRGVGAQVRPGMALLRMDEVREFERVADKEYRRVVADDVPIALFGIETQRKPAPVALGVGGTALAGDAGEAQELLGLLADAGDRLELRCPRRFPAYLQPPLACAALPRSLAIPHPLPAL